MDSYTVPYDPATFYLGDLVRVDDPNWEHHGINEKITIICEKSDHHKDEDYAGYGLYVPGHGECFWFRRSVLTLIKRGYLAEALEAMSKPKLADKLPIAYL